jgi:hypothetical protein
MEWEDIYKKKIKLGNERLLLVYFYPKKIETSNIYDRIKIKLMEKLIVPYLVTKKEYNDLKRKETKEYYIFRRIKDGATIKFYKSERKEIKLFKSLDDWVEVYK